MPKGVKLTQEEAKAKKHKSYRRGEKLDCRKKENKTLKECIERALKKRREAEERKKSGKRYTKSRKGVKQPVNRKRPKAHTTKSGVKKGGGIAQQVFRQDTITGRDTPQQTYPQPQPQPQQGINMGFGSPFGVGAVFNQLQTAQVKQREAETKSQTQIEKRFNQEKALKDRIEAQNQTILQRETQLDILRSRFDRGDFRGERQRVGGTEPARSVVFDDPRESKSIGDLQDIQSDITFHNDLAVKKKALQIKALNKDRLGGFLTQQSQLAGFVKDPSPLRIGEEEEEIKRDPFGEAEGITPPSPTPTDLDSIVPIEDEDVEGLSQSKEGREDLKKEEAKELNKHARRFLLTSDKTGKTAEVDFVYGGLSRENQKELYKDIGEGDIDEPFYLAPPTTDRYKHSLAPLVRPVGLALGSILLELRGDYYFGNRLGDKTQPKIIKKSKKGFVMPPPTDLEDPPLARWEQVRFSPIEGGESKIKGFSEYNNQSQFDEETGLPFKLSFKHSPLIKGGKGVKLPQSDLWGRYVSTFYKDSGEGDYQPYSVVWSPTTQSWIDRPEGRAGEFGRPREIYNSSLDQDREGMPQPFSSKGINRISEFGVADEEGKHNKISLGKVEELDLYLDRGDIVDSSEIE